MKDNLILSLLNDLRWEAREEMITIKDDCVSGG